MNKARILVLSIIVMFIGSVGVFAASDTAAHDVTMTVNEVVLIGLNDTGIITLTTNAPTNGGEAVAGDSDASKLLQYTSLVPSGQTRNITVGWGGGSSPAGTELSLVASGIPANCGTAAPSVTFTDGDSGATALITNVGSCATGVGSNGATLTYTFSVDNVTELVVAASTTPTITFTLTDAS